MRKKIFSANWKLNKNPEQTRVFFKEFLELNKTKAENEVIFFPPTTNLESTSNALKDSGVQWGAQNCFEELNGAFTGETSAQTIKDMGGKFILIGHSERRQYFGETDDLIARKVKKVQSIGLTPMLCIGETLEQRKANETQNILHQQIAAVAKVVNAQDPLVIAYEPVWAIGTGVVATPEQVKETHAQIREILKKCALSENLYLLYGGSVKGSNAVELASIPHVDGFLVGGASLEVKSFLEICHI